MQELEQLAKACEEIKDVKMVDFSGNGLADVTSLKDLSRLTKLNLTNNRIKNFAVFATEEAFPNLKWLDISHNKFNEWPGFKCPKLDYLNISGNKLEKVNEGWTGHANLRIISASDNKFKNLANFKNLPKLEELYLASNQITQLSGWEGGLPSLKRLHLRRNKIEKVQEEMVPLEELTYINLRHNNIAKLELAFAVFQFPKIEEVNFLNNPVEREASSMEVFMADFIIKKPSLKRFCKIPVTEAMQLHAVYQARHRWNKSEIERKEREAAEAAAAANE